MKFLLDMPVSSLLLKVLRAYGHEGLHAHQIGKGKGTLENFYGSFQRATPITSSETQSAAEGLLPL